MNNSEEKLGTWPLGRLMFSMGIPTLVAQLINLLYNLVDRVYIGQGVGREAVTGLGLTLPVITIISCLQFPCGMQAVHRLRRSHLDRAIKERQSGSLAMFLQCCAFLRLVSWLYFMRQKNHFCIW